MLLLRMTCGCKPVPPILGMLFSFTDQIDERLPFPVLCFEEGASPSKLSAGFVGMIRTFPVPGL
jgi:hypothetical protein